MPRPDIGPIRAVLESWLPRFPDRCAYAKFGIREIARHVRDFAPPLPENGIAWFARYPIFGLVFDFTYGWLDGVERLVFHRVGAGYPGQPDDLVEHLGYVGMLPNGDLASLPFAPRGLASADRVLAPSILIAIRRRAARWPVARLAAFGIVAAVIDDGAPGAINADRAHSPLPADYLRAHVPRCSSLPQRLADWPVAISNKELIMFFFDTNHPTEGMQASAQSMWQALCATPAVKTRARERIARCGTTDVESEPRADDRDVAAFARAGGGAWSGRLENSRRRPPVTGLGGYAGARPNGVTANPTDRIGG